MPSAKAANANLGTKIDRALEYLGKMTDQVGLVEHAKYHYPRKSEGYSVDDNARAYQVMLRLGKPGGVYLEFLKRAFSDDGFHNDLDFAGNWLDQPGYGEWFGRAISALGEGTKKGLGGDQAVCLQLIQQVLQEGINVDSIRNKAHVIWGISWYGKSETLLRNLADSLIEAFQAHSDSDWKWYESGLYYDNARLPLALFRAHVVSESQLYIKIAKESLDFLISRFYDPNADLFIFPGTNGWWKKHSPWALFDQQPLEAGSLIEACVECFKITADPQYHRWANLAWEWYEGKNLVKLSLVDDDSGGIRDGLHEDRDNLNEGAEAVLSYILAAVALNEIE